MSQCHNCQHRENEWKVRQSDLEFEIKRIKEDLAQEKVTLELLYQKESKKIIDKYHKERTMREAETKKWLAKYDLMVSEYELRLSQAN